MNFRSRALQWHVAHKGPVIKRNYIWRVIRYCTGYCSLTNLDLYPFDQIAPLHQFFLCQSTGQTDFPVKQMSKLILNDFVA